MMNLSASHDAPRLLTCFANREKYKFAALPRDNASYDTRYPDKEVYDRVKLFLLHQYTFVGSPHIWNGDEMGMVGADDPDCRKPLAWEDLTFETETQPPLADSPYQQKVEFNHDLFAYYKSLISLRKSSATFIYGEYRFIEDYVKNNLLAYSRTLDEESFLMIFNVNAHASSVKLPREWTNSKVVFRYGDARNSTRNELILPPFSAVVLGKTQK
jgi:glycosidase